jgi:hypothetical protein
MGAHACCDLGSAYLITGNIDNFECICSVLNTVTGDRVIDHFEQADGVGSAATELQCGRFFRSGM